MVQFTLGLILIVLSLFFGGREVMANKKVVETREEGLKAEQKRVDRAQKLSEKFTVQHKDLIEYSANIKSNLVDQLNIDQTKYNFNLIEPQKKQQAMLDYHFEIEGYNSFKSVYTLLSDIEKTKGLFIDNVCLNCKIANPTLVPSSATDISFKIEGIAYVFKNK